jgi:hypothetical protein
VARPWPLRPDPQGPERTRGGSRRGRRCGEGSGERARPPKAFPLRSGLGCAAATLIRPRSPKCAPPKRGVAYFRSFGFTGGTQPRPVTASAGSHRVPSHSDLNVTPRPPPRLASRRSPGLAGGELQKGPGTLAKAMGPTWRSLTPRGEWLPPKRNTAGVASRSKVTGSDSSRCAIARVSAQDQRSASATNEGDGLNGDNFSSQR